ncbi:MAG: GPR endopeptidase [Candidatus Merdivicinus sp.]
MNIRTDLAVEQLTAVSSLPDGAYYTEMILHGIPSSLVEIKQSDAAVRLHKPIGRYYTLSCPPFAHPSDNFEQQAEAVAEALSDLLPPEGTVLVVGLGNSSITPDALGPETIHLMLATRHIRGEQAMQAGLEGLRSAAAIAPGVLGQTGMESAEIIAALVHEIHPVAVIAIDALAAADISRLGCTVQICDSGISPGSGVSNRRRELSKNTLGIPVIAMGVPTVVDYHAQKDSPPLMVTPREVDTIIENAAKTIAFGINRALQPSLSMEDLLALVN